MEKLFVPYSIALKLKEKGFDEECFGVFHSGGDLTVTIQFEAPRKNTELLKYFVAAPTYQQAIDWLFPKLEFNYPFTSIQIFGDGSGEWYSPEDRDGSDILNEKLLVEFDNLNEAIEKVLNLI